MLSFMNREGDLTRIRSRWFTISTGIYPTLVLSKLDSQVPIPAKKFSIDLMIPFWLAAEGLPTDCCTVMLVVGDVVVGEFITVVVGDVVVGELTTVVDGEMVVSMVVVVVARALLYETAEARIDTRALLAEMSAFSALQVASLYPQELDCWRLATYDCVEAIVLLRLSRFASSCDVATEDLEAIVLTYRVVVVPVS